MQPGQRVLHDEWHRCHDDHARAHDHGVLRRSVARLLFVHALGETTNYKVASGALTLTQKNGTLQFTSTKPTATAAPSASVAEVPQGSPGGQALTGKGWQLTAITEKVPAFQGVVPADQQANYTITFNDDKTFDAKADCNSVGGQYETGDPAASSGPLTITPGPSTLVACPDGSLGDLFVVGLGNAESYAIEADGLTIARRRRHAPVQVGPPAPPAGPAVSIKTHALADQLRLDRADIEPVERLVIRSERAAATPAPWPLTVQHIMLRVDACETLSPPMQRPATIRWPTPAAARALDTGTWK